MYAIIPLKDGKDFFTLNTIDENRIFSNDYQPNSELNNGFLGLVESTSPKSLVPVGVKEWAFVKIEEESDKIYVQDNYIKFNKAYVQFRGDKIKLWKYISNLRKEKKDLSIYPIFKEYTVDNDVVILNSIESTVTLNNLESAIVNSELTSIISSGEKTLSTSIKNNTKMTLLGDNSLLCSIGDKTTVNSKSKNNLIVLRSSNNIIKLNKNDTLILTLLQKGTNKVTCLDSCSVIIIENNNSIVYSCPKDLNVNQEYTF